MQMTRADKRRISLKFGSYGSDICACLRSTVFEFRSRWRTPLEAARANMDDVQGTPFLVLLERFSS